MATTQAMHVEIFFIGRDLCQFLGVCNSVVLTDCRQRDEATSGLRQEMSHVG